MNEEEIKNEDVVEDEDIELDLEDELDDTVTISKDELERLRKDSEIKAQLLARAKKAESEKNDLKQKNYKRNPERDDDIRQTVSELKLAEQKRQFGYENGLAPDEADYLFKINPAPTKELLEDPFIKGGLEAIRSAKRVSNNTPSISGRSTKFELPKKKEDLSPDEKQEAFEKFTQNRFRK